MIKKIIKFLSSLRFTIWLITLLGVVFALGLWIPQKRLLKDWYLQWQQHSPKMVAFLDALQLTDIYTSPITLTLWLFFFLNLSLVMWQRIPLIKKRIAVTPDKIVDPATASGYSFSGSYQLADGMDYQSVTTVLKKSGYTLIEKGGVFYGVKNRLSPIAFALFHISFFLILIGGTISVYTEFYGYLELVEGTTFKGELEAYSSKPAPPSLPKLGSPPAVFFTVKKVLPLVSGFTETGLKVTLTDQSGRDHEIDINQPYKDDSSTFVLKSLGMAPLFVMSDSASGKELDGAYVRLDCLKGRSDKFSMAGYNFKVRFYPDYMLDDGKHATRTLEFNNPVFILDIEKDKKSVGEVMLTDAKPAEFDGKRLEIRENPFWVRFIVMKEHGIPILYTGFVIASLAVVWRFIWYRREILGKVRNENGSLVVVLLGRSEFYKSLAKDEFSRFFGKLFTQKGESTK